MMGKVDGGVKVGCRPRLAATRSGAGALAFDSRLNGGRTRPIPALVRISGISLARSGRRRETCTEELIPCIRTHRTRSTATPARFALPPEVALRRTSPGADRPMLPRRFLYAL